MHFNHLCGKRNYTSRLTMLTAWVGIILASIANVLAMKDAVIEMNY